MPIQAEGYFGVSDANEGKFDGKFLLAGKSSIRDDGLQVPLTNEWE